MITGIVVIGQQATPIGSFEFGGRRLSGLVLGPMPVWVGERLTVAVRQSALYYPGERFEFDIADDVPYALIEVPPRSTSSATTLVRPTAGIGSRVAYVQHEAL